MNITKLEFFSGYVDWDDGCIQQFVADFKIVADGKEYEGLAGYYGVHAEEMREDCFEIHWGGAVPEDEEPIFDVMKAAFDRFVCIRVECVPFSLEEAIQEASDAAYDRNWNPDEENE
jgi:hypothetical protein